MVGTDYKTESVRGLVLMFELLNCPCKGVTLDRLIQPAVLLVLTEGPLHGYRLAERLGEMPSFSGQKPDVSGIYRYLKWMEQRGLVVSSWDLSESGPARRCYEITDTGRDCFDQWVNTLKAYRQGITELLRAARKVTGKQPGK